jgi:phospholipid/cholesterol/gamma-HCH transport system permease protein
MNAIALLGRRVIERVRGIGVASLMLLQILFSMPTALGVRLFVYQMYRVGVLSLLIIAGVRFVYWRCPWLTDV